MNYTSSMQTKTNGRHLPEGWQWVKLGDICETTSGGTPLRGTANYYGGNIPWVKSGELNDGSIYSTEETITELALQNSSAKLFPAGTLLIALYGATVGRLGILNMDAATNQAVCAIFTSKEIDRDYLFHYLLSKRTELIDISFGGAQPNISQEIIRSIEIPLLPLDEQRRIASRLNEQLAAVESARKAAEEQLQAARQLPSAYLREVFEGELAHKYHHKQLGELCDIKLGKMLSPASKTGTRPRPYLRNLNVQWGYFDLSDVAEMDFKEDEEKKYELRSGDLMVCEGGEPGRAAVWNGELQPCYFQKALHRLRPINNSVDATYIMYRLWLGAVQREFIDSNAHTTIAHLPKIRLEKLSIPVPPLDEQRRMVGLLKEHMAKSNEVVVMLESQLAEIESLPASLLREAFGGQNVPQVSSR